MVGDLETEPLPNNRGAPFLTIFIVFFLIVIGINVYLLTVCVFAHLYNSLFFLQLSVCACVHVFFLQLSVCACVHVFLAVHCVGKQLFSVSSSMELQQRR